MSVKNSQNKDILEYLKEGGTITCLQAWTKFGCSALHSRIADIRNHLNEPVSDIWIKVKGKDGVVKNVKQYFINKEAA